MAFQKAERKKAKLRLGISGPSGSGKTYSALLIAYGMTGDWDKVALIDTERGSGELYADLGGYSVCQIEPPFTPQKYIAAIKEAESAGFETVIIDSLSHAWSGEGGMLEKVDKISAASSSKNSYFAWREVTPDHNKLVDTFLGSRCHTIATLRSKTEYEIQTVDGKKTPVKIGLSPIFRDGFEYECTTFLDISQNHNASASKDRTRLFDSKFFIPTVETGKELCDWFNKGADILACDDCGLEIKGNSKFTAKQLADNSFGACGKKLCMACAKVFAANRTVEKVETPQQDEKTETDSKEDADE